MAEPFDPERYWNSRLGERYSLDGVGWAGMGETFNRWMYRLRRHVFLREVGALLRDPGALSVLDVGSGTGFYVELWHELGAGEVTASDFTEVAVRNLTERFPGDRVVRLDITGPDPASALGEARFDAISAMDMLFHIVDDAAYGRAIDNLVALLEPGGLLVFTENFVRGHALRGQEQVSRTADEIGALLHAAGAEPVRTRPMFVLMNTPVNSESRLLRAWWSYLDAVVRRGPRTAGAAGAVAYALERGALPLAGARAPSTQLSIWRRRT